MPLVNGNRAQSNTEAAGTAFDFVLTGLTVGNTLIIRGSASNSGSSGAARTLTVSNQVGTAMGAHTEYQKLNDPGAASDGVVCDVSVITIAATSGTIRFTYSGNVLFAGIAEEWSDLGAVVGTPVTANGVNSTNLVAGTALTEASVALGNMVYSAIAIEGPAADTITQDADTTGGAWVPLTKLGGTNATATTNQTTYAEYKYPTAAGAQTSNPTISSARDSAGIIIEFVGNTRVSPSAIASVVAMGAPSMSQAVAVTVVRSFVAMAGPPASNDYLRYGVTKAASSNYLYEDLTDTTDYVIQSGDHLEYDIWLEGSVESFMGIDFTCGAGALRDQGWTDQNGVPAHPALGGLVPYAADRWYHRKIAIPAGGFIGSTITNYDLVRGGNTTTDTQYARFRSILITDGAGTTRKTIWNGDSTPTVAQHLIQGTPTFTLAYVPAVGQVTETPAAVASVVAMGAPAVPATPVAIASVVSLSAPVVGISAVPAAIASFVAISDPTEGITAVPVAVASVVAMAAPVVDIGAPAVAVASVVDVPAVTVQVGVVASPSAVEMIVAMAAAGISETTFPSAVASIIEMAAPVVGISAAPAVVTSVVAMGAPTVDAAEADLITFGPIAMVAHIAQGTGIARLLLTDDEYMLLSDGSKLLLASSGFTVGISALPSSIAVVVAMAAPTVAITTAPAAIASTFALPAPYAPVSMSAIGSVVAVGASLPQVIAGAVAMVVDVPPASIPGSTVVSPNAIEIIASIPAAVVAIGVMPSAVAMVIEMGAPTVLVETIASPAVIESVIAMAAPVVAISAAPQAVAMVVELGAPSVSVGVAVDIAAVAMVIGIGMVIVSTRLHQRAAHKRLAIAYIDRQGAPQTQARVSRPMGDRMGEPSPGDRWIKPQGQRWNS